MKKIVVLVMLMISSISGVFAMTYDEAKVQDKPIVIMFHMHGCSACRKFSPRFNKIAKQFSYKFNFIKEDVDSSKIAKLCDSETVPAFYIMQPKTQKIERINDECVWDKGCFTKTLQEYK